MIRNYIKIALRNIQRNTIYSFINITGLAVGIACSILILLWVNDELSYDQFHKNYDNLYQVYMNQEFSEGIGSQQALPYPLKQEIKEKAAPVKHVVIVNWGEGNLLTAGEKRLNKIGISASEDFLKMFSFEALQGDVNTALTEPTAIVITESTATALFGEENAMNKLIRIDNDRELKVSAIIKDPPSQSSFELDYILPFSFYEATQSWVRESRESWDNNSFRMFVELHPNITEEQANQAIVNLVKDNNKDAQSAQLFLHPMSKWRLYSSFENGKSVGGMIEYVRLFTAIAVFILVIACINFMNLATARSASRAREVGIRKSVGSRRKELIGQFLGESLFITFISFLLALLIVELVMPFYNTVVDKKLFINYTDPKLWLAALSLIVITGVVAGSYPAFYLSAFNPARVLKGNLQSAKKGGFNRKMLVTLQFAFSILLIVGTVVIYKQIEHVKSREIGYDRENLMLIWTTSEIETGYQTIKDELLRTGAVEGVCKSNSPITRIFSSNTVQWPGMPEGPPVSFTTIATEYDYTKTLGVKMLEGRDFSPEFPSDTMAVIINKAALDRMALKDPIGTQLDFWGSKRTIIGVTENVIMGSPYEPVDPLIMVFIPGWSSTITVRLGQTADLPASIAKVEEVFKKYNPAYPFSYRFADTEFDQKFSMISLISKLATSFASLAILITCLGLFGLAAFTAEQRTKEIGIRKVMGASVSSLVVLISKDFSRLVLIAFVFTAPLAWWACSTFLERYAYRIEFPLWVIPVSGAVVLSIALGIVATQALRAATSNPSQSLRNE
jgi:putative ABC transport system permease protein